MTDNHEILARNVLAQQDGPSTPATLAPVTIGMSEAAVFRATQAGHAPRYVKVALGAAAVALRDEIARTQWLSEHGIAVPQLLRIEDRGAAVAVLMEAIAGVPADVSRLPTPLFVEALAKALAAIHALPAAACPFDETLAVRLARAETAVTAGDIDPAEFEPHNRNVAPADLLRRLRAERPDEDTIVLHGDLTLGNIIIDDKGGVGFIDCGNAGRGDRYTDLALLHADIAAHRGDAAAAQFLRHCGEVDFDATKARYFLDLYELF